MARLRTCGLAIALAALGATSGAQALTLGPAPTGRVHLRTVALGCSPGWTRGVYGRCRPIVYAPLIYAPPLDDLRCAWRQTPFGPRRVCRW